MFFRKRAEGLIYVIKSIKGQAISSTYIARNELFAWLSRFVSNATWTRSSTRSRTGMAPIADWPSRFLSFTARNFLLFL